ncbi:PfkB family carbohydrate kinase [Lapillicoccus jejuensis]|uniref:Sugar/nucleoside kinase (Ribokinase family) n=1 Tax=Lapillicoccus jejuensis TaxID=402171 RepID=A0A542E6W8_9MICO|nr:PfkB family carbohydrate kinase [Lapillicoccus jejuensis]TQJ11070.1 sugar/nucleoside kinase (ribokinase family) [Lapillicoccus jejuensis]
MAGGYDPLAAQRGPGEPEFDVLLAGTVFLDIIFTGLPALPTGGTEVWAEGMGSCPGGIANLATATSRLGLRTSLAAAFGDDDYADFCWRTLEQQEGVDLSRSRRFDGWHSPVTVSMALDHDRGMLTHGHPSPLTSNQLIGEPPTTRSVLVDLAEAFDGEGPSWVEQAAASGALVFGDIGWDASGSWSPAVLDRLEHCHAFLPNAPEAMAYTRADTAHDALYSLADRVPLAVVTLGPEGAIAIDGTTGEEASVPALRVPALDATGAGDVFAAALVLGTLRGWPLGDRLAFATLCSSLAVQQFGGSLAAPGWGDLADWWHAARSDPATTAYATAVRRRFAFLDDVLPDQQTLATGAPVRRAAATVARQSDA